MEDDRPLRPASREELSHTISYGLRFDTTGKSHRLAGDIAAQLAAEMLVRHLEQSGYVVMQRPPARPPTTNGHMTPEEFEARQRAERRKIEEGE